MLGMSLKFKTLKKLKTKNDEEIGLSSHYHYADFGYCGLCNWYF